MINEMVITQLTKRGIQDQKILDAMSRVPRHLFVPSTVKEFAYEDRPLPIGYEQTISQPYIVAYMTEKLNLNRQKKVLEIGTGSGYQTAILAELSKFVYTIEIIHALSRRAKKTLRSLEYKNIKFKTGDGNLGWKEHGPYDAIIITASPKTLPNTFLSQLSNNGQLIVPIHKNNHQILALYTKTKNEITREELIHVRFVPLITKTV
ncbi:protein-L-isoaspartate(D-aspartate) O-methyltransferase [Carboxylicivirga sp. M1479]|uniref:protein-L-isoaspartate(D-aspartate) O-methyltransferase n=1 Tax=Carboxylicivirga sp. M1479 TaxID=2594476 RepID=UPI0021075929|nr:protein-L-isoaspartate(D-aspartate) O-methyltransferase [Carboxylicivirga sp. M1479]